VISAPGEFLDSNVLVYAFTTDPRAARAQGLLARGCTISVQGLNEFTNVARRKLR
jgi:predicted nucleic acid-binding protein